MQSIVIPERLSMWFRVYCESLLTELECHVLWQGSSRLDAHTSLLFWIKKGRNGVRTAALSALACCGCLITCARLNSQFKVLTIMSWYLFCELRKWITILSENARKPWTNWREEELSSSEGASLKLPSVHAGKKNSKQKVLLGNQAIGGT